MEFERSDLDKQLENFDCPVWSEDYATGFKAIDDDHKDLFKEIGILKNLIDQHDSTDHIEQVISSLENYTVEHFSREEAFMIGAGYPETIDHMKKHRALTHKIDCLRILYHESPEQIDTYKLLKFLSQWLVNHIVKDDMNYIPYLKGEQDDADHDIADSLQEISVSLPRDKSDLIKKFIHIATSDHPAAKKLTSAIELFEIKLDERDLEAARKDFCK